MKPIVVVVSGHSGSGKSTVVTELAKRLNCAYLLFDNYASKADFPNDITQWVQEGCDPNVIQTPKLREDLLRLLSGSSVERSSGSGWAKEYYSTETNNKLEQIKPTDIILIEEPFGREREELAEFIDLVIYLDVATEIALARRVLDLVRAEQLRSDPEGLVTLLDHFLFDYLHTGVREMFLSIGSRVMNNCDLLVDSTKDVEEIVENIANKIKEYNGIIRK
ncbi:hypothetical protein [Paenibacillus sp. sgz500958]|uniref:hypothetical protein n=1 Tax=Paenibacillus sp. sgz500958 TaxID=3242475 RepID=UPI0036D2CF4A